MTGLRFCLHCGILSDLPWMKDIGFDEGGLVTPSITTMPTPSFRGTEATIPTATAIHDNLNYATLDPFNDGAAGINALGGTFVGPFQAAHNAGWDMLAGVGISGDVVRTAMNYMSFCNYGADDSTNVYSYPYNHPTTGPNTYHVDYITTWTSGRWYQDCIDAQAAAVAAGGYAEVGILIGLWADALLESERWISVIKAARSQGVPCNNVCFWGDPSIDGVELLKTGQGFEVLTGLMREFGVRHGMGSV
jgi:hypothetical protein